MVHYVKGNLLNSDCHFICHQVNCQGKMNSGIAKSIREKYPKAYIDYMLWYQKEHSYRMFNHICVAPAVDKTTIIHMASQYDYGYDGKRYTSYDAFWLCLGEIRQMVRKGDTIAFPHKIGCCRGGANWEVIRTMIKEALGYDYEVYIYEYEGE